MAMTHLLLAASLAAASMTPIRGPAAEAAKAKAAAEAKAAKAKADAEAAAAAAAAPAATPAEAAPAAPAPEATPAAKPAQAPAAIPAPSSTASKPAATPIAPTRVSLRSGGPGADELLSFLHGGERSSERDGSKVVEWEGLGAAQLRMSREFLDARNAQLATADAAATRLLGTVTRFYENPAERPVREVREELLQIGRTLEPVREALRGAVDQEQKRLTWLQKGIQAAGGSVAGLDPDLVKRRLTVINSGRAGEAVEARIRGYQGLVTGLVAYIDGDPLTALEKMKVATRDAPDVSLGHAYLGSLYYLFNQPQLALSEWRRTLELDPHNEAVKQALKDHAGEVR